MGGDLKEFRIQPLKFERVKQNGGDCMTELHMYVAYLTVWTIYQLWSIHRWMKSESKEEKAENAGHALQEI